MHFNAARIGAFFNACLAAVEYQRKRDPGTALLDVAKPMFDQ